MKVIGFAGLGQAGKTTAAVAAAAILFEEGFTPVMERFAGPLKDASDMVGMSKGNGTDHLYREFCQTVGAVARQESADWWVNLLHARINVMAEMERLEIQEGIWHERVLIVDDVRYINEVELIHKMGGKVIFISALRRLQMAGLMKEPWREHVSEQMARQYESGVLADSTFDFSISNNDPKGEDAFINCIGPLVTGLCRHACEEIR
jgi:hypothetical protein